MSLNISDTQRCTIWEIEEKGKFSQVRMSSSRKDKDTGDYINSNWSFVRFVGKAHAKISELGLKSKDRIVLKGATVSLEPYVDVDGVKKYPKQPRLTVFNWEYLEPTGEPSNMDAPPVIEEEDGDLPF